MEERFKEIDALIKQCNDLESEINTIKIFNMNDGVNEPEEISREDSRWKKLISSIQTYFELYSQDHASVAHKEKLEKLYSFSRLAHDKRIDMDRLDKIVGCLEMLKNAVKLEQTRKMRYDVSIGEDTANNTTFESSVADKNKVFIVHGHDGELKEQVARLLERQGIEPIVLNEQANCGRTIIEKIETYADTVDCAICLFTADDEMSDKTKRARQNVVFEAGYFYGKIGRKHTIIIADTEMMKLSENLSDLSGVVYVSKTDWKLDVLRELSALGYKISFDKIP